MIAPPRAPRMPRAPRPPSIQRVPTGTPRPRRAREVGQSDFGPPEEVARYPGSSRLEQIVFWWLVTKRRYRPGIDFLFQEAIGTDGVVGGPANSKGFLRTDFVLLPQGQHGGLGYPYERGLVLNPFPLMGSGSFQIHTIHKDRLERGILAQLHYRVVYLEDGDLETRTDDVLRLALRGVDISAHSA